MLFITAIIRATFFGTEPSPHCYLVRLLYVRRSSVWWYHCGFIICGYYKHQVLQFGDITVVLFGTVFICAALFVIVISLWCYLIQLLLVRRSSVGWYHCGVIRYGYYSCNVLRYRAITALLFGMVIIRAALFSTVIPLQC